MPPEPGRSDTNCTARRRRARVGAWVVAVAVLLGLLAGLPRAADAVPAGNPPVVAPGPSFGVRAGYSPSLLSEVAGVVPATGARTVVVTFSPSHPGLFDAPSPQAPPLTVAEVGDRFGLSPTQYAAAERYFVGQGLTVLHAGADRLSLTLAGPVGTVDRAFATTLDSGLYQGRSVTLPSTAPSLPPFLEAEVAGVTGLTTGFDVYSLPLAHPPTVPDARPGQGSADLVTPAVAREIYAASDLYNYSGRAEYASNEGIALLLWGDGYDPTDLSTFFTTYYPSGMFPSPTIQPYPVDGAPAPAPSALSDPSNAPEELTLDLEWAGSLAPGATLDAVYAPDGPSSDNYSPTDASMADALHTAVTGVTGVDVISMSFGTTESTASGLETAWTTDFAEAAQEKITLVAATGDTGGDTASSPSCSGVPAPEYPASDPAVLAVGGTDPTLSRNLVGQVTGLASESAWAGSGGGFSTQYAAPSWQEVGSAAGPIRSSGFRGMPDVAASAANNFVYYSGQEESGAGTSFATPLWAGVVAEMDALHGGPLGLLTPRLYSVGAAEPTGTVADGLVDITSGSNCLGPATTGWDTATGWGSPRALDLYADLTSTFVNLSVVASPAPVAPGGSVTVIATLTNASTGAPIGGVEVDLALTADTAFGPCVGTFGAASPKTNQSGVATAALAVPDCYLGSRAVATATVMSNGYFGSNQTSVGVSLLAYLGFLGPVASYPTDVVVYGLIMGAAIVAGYFLGRSRPARQPVATAIRVPVSDGSPPATPEPASPEAYATGWSSSSPTSEPNYEGGPPST